MGNKIDKPQEERRVSETDARRMADQNNMHYYESSAKESINIQELMDDIMSQIYH